MTQQWIMDVTVRVTITEDTGDLAQRVANDFVENAFSLDYQEGFNREYSGTLPIQRYKIFPAQPVAPDHPEG